MDPRLETKDDWLRAQEEHRHRHVVTVNQGLVLTPSLYFGTRRCTYSDVISVITTTKPLPRITASQVESTKKLSSNNAQWATSPLTKQSTVDAAFPPPSMSNNNGAAHYIHAPLEGDSERKKRFRSRQAFALKQERSLFLTTLQQQRHERFHRENAAALVIQRVYRGFQLRRRFTVIKEKLRVRKRIRVNLVKVTKGTAIITGEKERKARILAARNAAASKIQHAFQQWLARRLLQREKLRLRDEQRAIKATVIQCRWRRGVAIAATRKLRSRLWMEQRQQLAREITRLYLGYQARQRVHRIRLHRQLLASQRIQDAVRRFHARKTLVLQRRWWTAERHNRAAVRIQRLARGAAARQRVLRLRIDEDQAIRVACVLSIQRVCRGFLGRRRMRYYRFFHVHTLAWQCALHLTRIVRGFLARRRVQYERLEQETDLLVQIVRGNTSTVIDLLDGYGLVDQPVDMTVTNYATRNNCLHLAAKFGRLEILAHVLPKILEQAPDMAIAMNTKGETPLELAICHGHEKLASFLLTKTADVLLRSTAVHKRKVTRGLRERSLILDAAKHGMGAVVHKLTVLFPQYYDGKERDAWSKRTVLHEALLLPTHQYEDKKAATAKNEVMNGTLTTILSKLSVDINAQDLVGFTPLHLASMRGNVQAVKTLLDHGADVSLLDREGRSAWRIALLLGHEACFLEIRRKWLSEVAVGDTIDAGAADMGKALADAATKSRRQGWFHLHPHLERDAVHAARQGDLHRVQFYVEELHVSINSTDPEGDGDSLLMAVLERKHMPLLRYLASTYGSELDVAYVNKAGRSITDVALQSPVLMKTLIHYAQLNPCLPLDTAKLHRTASHEAVRRGYNLREWLRGSVFMPSMLLPLVDDSGRTPLHDAAAFGNVASAKLLLNAGLRVDVPDAESHRTPLHDACRSGQLAVVRKMVATCPQALWLRDAAHQLPVADATASGSVECLNFVVASMNERKSGDVAMGQVILQNALEKQQLES